ncbi:AAA family ATPase [Streptomyces sp. NPDC057555]|uniref:AAA family ATPase n=1 Tax=Streptomyces sp. NPDC057555 TaxID=3346166 RepID=UPI00368C20A9
MRLLRLSLPAYRGLHNFQLDLTDAVDAGHAIAMLIGPNGGGKSRALHALAEIFGALHQPKHRAAFAYDVHYEMRGKTVRAVQTSREATPELTVAQADRAPMRVPRVHWPRHLPDHVFGYQAHPHAPWTAEFDQHRRFAARRLGNWRRQWREDLDDWLASRSPDEAWPEQLTLPISCPLYTPVFLCTPAHLPLLLLSQTTHWSDSFGTYLREHSYIQRVASAVLRIKAPRTARGTTLAALPYWGLGGPARTLFAAAADSGRFGLIPDADPVDGAGSPADGFRIVLSTAEDVRAFRNLFDSDLSMFGLLATLLDAGYLTVDVRLQTTGATTFGVDDLSSGEQQLLTILGLLRLQRAQESIFLLDEPDSHFHPEWSRRWYSSVRTVLGAHRDSQFIAATHDPLLVANMTRQQIRVVTTGAEGQATAVAPRTNPRGQGAGGLLTTVFGLPTQLDEHTQELIDRQYELLPIAADDPERQAELKEVTAKLDALGFSTANRDPHVSAFLSELHRRRRALIEAARGANPPPPEELETLVAELFHERFSSVI